jgi:hypothetical protein
MRLASKVFHVLDQTKIPSIRFLFCSSVVRANMPAKTLKVIKAALKRKFLSLLLWSLLPKNTWIQH